MKPSTFSSLLSALPEGQRDAVFSAAHHFVQSFVTGGFRNPIITDLHNENVLFLYSRLLDHFFARHDPGILQTTEKLEQIEIDLHRFTKALRNYEYSVKTKIPFKDLARGMVDREEASDRVMNLGKRLNNAKFSFRGEESLSKQHDIITAWRQSIAPFGPQERAIRYFPTTELILFASRVLVAVFGGLSLVVPMLIMSINPTLTKSLVTTSAFVIAFGVGMATFMPQAESKDLVTSTAAYAAVLVVFVGVGGGT
ncbi:MAG: hypothetical protein M1821_005759 [Bathelium mastoideum]|nr:MAG: hypothetical protein M1821_005759 [Bathelium mastoideum]